MEAYVQDVINRYELGKKGLDIEEQKLVKDVVLGLLEIALKGAGAALGAKVGKQDFNNMCLYPKLIPNKRYLPTKKNGGVPPVCPDERLRYITAACGDCYECRKQKQRQWVVRMSEENRQTPNAYFLTLTIDDKSYKELKKKYKLKDNNDIATKAIRLCLERVRKQTGKSIKHWFITELGHEKTERLHLHGIVWGLGDGKK